LLPIDNIDEDFFAVLIFLPLESEELSLSLFFELIRLHFLVVITELFGPIEGVRLDGWSFVAELLTDISTMHIDGNNRNELGSKLFGQVDSLDSDNQLVNSTKDLSVEILHGTFSTIFKLINGSLSVLSPDDQSDDQSDLSTEKLDPAISLKLIFTLLWHLPGI
jgi:hypothetical protein